MVPLKEYVDKADEAVESRVYARLDKVATKGSVWGAAATVLGIVLAALAFASDRFDSGITVQSALEPALAQQRQRDAQQDRKFDEILSRLPPRQPPQPSRKVQALRLPPAGSIRVEMAVRESQ